MGDILSRDEIDALLSATEDQKLVQLLRKKGLDDKQVAGYTRYLEGLGGSDQPAAELEAAAIAQAHSLEGKKLSAKDRTALEQETKRLIAHRREQRKMKPPPQKPRIVTSYDFKHPARVNKDQLRTLENLHDNYARLLSSTFSGAMRAVVDVDTAFVDQTTYAEFIMSLSNPSCSYQFTLGPTNGQAIIDIAMPCVFAFVDRIFGGKGSSQGVDARQLSQVEMGIMARILKRMIQDLEATWEPILRVEISDIELETNPEFMQITAASEIVILLAFEINSTNASGLVSLCYPFFTLESILPRLGQQSYVRMGRQNRDEVIRQNRERLLNTYLPLRAELGSGTIGVEAARRLRVGDVVQLETQTDEPAVVYVGDEPKYLGVPFAGPHDRKTVKVARVIPWNEEELYKNRSRPVPILDQR